MNSFGSKPAITVHKESCRKKVMAGYKSLIMKKMPLFYAILLCVRNIKKLTILMFSHYNKVLVICYTCSIAVPLYDESHDPVVIRSLLIKAPSLC
jgi:hypothetical protein